MIFNIIYNRYLKKSFLLLILFPLIVATSCSQDENPEPDQRAKFVGYFEMEISEIYVQDDIQDTLVEVTISEELDFRLNGTLGKEELEIRLERFIETLFEEVFQLPSRVEIESTVRARISGNKFTVDGFNGEVEVVSGPATLPLPWRFAADGELDDNDDDLTLDFSIVIGDQGIPVAIISGTANGAKDD